MISTLSLLVLLLLLPGNRSLLPAWSPDHQILATTKVSERFVTPEGANYVLLLNGRPVYPEHKKARWSSAYTNEHTFLTELHWSPDSQRVAFLEKVYDWEYSDPYNRDFDGWASKIRFYLVVVSRDGKVAGYPLSWLLREGDVQWPAASKLTINGRLFDLDTNPPGPIQ